MKRIFTLFILSLFVAFSIESYCMESSSPGDDITNDFKLYPNPVTGSTFTLVSEYEVLEISVLNVLGQQVYTRQILNEKKVVVELDTDKRGLYLVQIKTVDNHLTTKRILFK